MNLSKNKGGITKENDLVSRHALTKYIIYSNLSVFSSEEQEAWPYFFAGTFTEKNVKRGVLLKKSIVGIRATCHSQSEEFKWKMLADWGEEQNRDSSTLQQLHQGVHV